MSSMKRLAIIVGILGVALIAIGFLLDRPSQPTLSEIPLEETGLVQEGEIVLVSLPTAETAGTLTLTSLAGESLSYHLITSTRVRVFGQLDQPGIEATLADLRPGLIVQVIVSEQGGNSAALVDILPAKGAES